MNAAAIAPIVILLIAWVVFALYDLSRSEVKYLPKWLWAVIIVVSIPLGGVVYFLIGRDGS
jgi:intergrase/recombinase